VGLRPVRRYPVLLLVLALLLPTGCHRLGMPRPRTTPPATAPSAPSAAGPGPTAPPPATRPAAPPATEPSAPRAQESGGLDGTWKAVAWEIDGQQVPAEQVAANPAVMVLAGNTIAFKVGNRVVGEGTIKTDPDRQPKTIDITGASLVGGQAGRSVTSLGIYEVTGDTLRICFVGGAGAQRPQTFSTASGGTMVTYRRVR